MVFGLSSTNVPNKTAETIAQTFVENWMTREARHPCKLLSDRGREFENELFTLISQLSGLKQNFSVGYNPRENGLTERMNRTLISMLAKTTAVPLDWDRRLPFVLYAYDTSPHETMGESPYFLLHGTDPIFPFTEEIEKRVTWYLFDMDEFRSELMLGLSEIRDTASKNIQAAQAKMKQYYDQRNNVKEDVFHEGQRVLVYMPNGKARIMEPTMVMFEAGGVPRSAVNLEDTLCAPEGNCTSKSCEAGVQFGQVITNVPEAVCVLRFVRIEDLAQVINFWKNPNYRVKKKTEILVHKQFQLPAVPQKEDYVEAISALASTCSHLAKFLQHSAGYPLYLGKDLNLANRDSYVEAVEAVRSKLIHS